MGIRVGSTVRVNDDYFGDVAGKTGTVSDRCCGTDEDLECFRVSFAGRDVHLFNYEVTLVNERADIERALAVAQAKVETLRAQLEALPPFSKGQKVRVALGKARGQKVTVLACERAFGQWMAQVAFPGNEEPYTYPCDKLEAA